MIGFKIVRVQIEIKGDHTVHRPIWFCQQIGDDKSEDTLFLIIISL